MAPDLGDALVPLNWADAQIAVFRERLGAWQRTRPYELVMERNPNAPEIQFLAAYQKKPIDPLLVGDTRAIINSIGAALDILWMLILRRHDVEPGRDSSFPVKRSVADFEAAADVLKRKYGCTDEELAAVKRSKAYKGGDDFLYPLHQLDSQPWHYRLLLTKPTVDAGLIGRTEGAFLYPTPLTGQHKSILAGIPSRARFRPTYSNVALASEVFLDEPAFLKPDMPAALVLDRASRTVRAIVEKFP